MLVFRNTLNLLLSILLGLILCAVFYISNLFFDYWWVALLVCVPGLAWNRNLLRMGHSCDAMGSSRTRDKMLVIIKDKRFGTMGICAIIFAVLFRYIFIAETIYRLPFEGVMPILLIAPVSGYVTMAVGAVTSKPVSLRERRISRLGYFDMAIVLLVCFGISWALIGLRAAVLTCLLQASAGILLSVFISARLGGLTDEILGLFAEIGTLFYWFITLMW